MRRVIIDGTYARIFSCPNCHTIFSVTAEDIKYGPYGLYCKCPVCETVVQDRDEVYIHTSYRNVED